MRQSGPRPRRFQTRDTVLLSGWLFADLLLALFVIFLSANMVEARPQQTPTPVATKASKPTPTPTFTPTPIPTPTPRVDLTKHHLILPIDHIGLLNDSPAAQQSLAQEVRAQSFLQNRLVGLVIAYGNAADPTQITNAQLIAQKVMNVLKMLGQQGFAFAHSAYYDPLYSLYSKPDLTEIDLYLFAQQ